MHKLGSCEPPVEPSELPRDILSLALLFVLPEKTCNICGCHGLSSALGRDDPDPGRLPLRFLGSCESDSVRGCPLRHSIGHFILLISCCRTSGAVERN